jgi:hypothetical protein
MAPFSRTAAVSIAGSIGCGDVRHQNDAAQFAIMFRPYVRDAAVFIHHDGLLHPKKPCAIPPGELYFHPGGPELFQEIEANGISCFTGDDVTWADVKDHILTMLDREDIDHVIVYYNDHGTRGGMGFPFEIVTWRHFDRFLAKVSRRYPTKRLSFILDACTSGMFGKYIVAKGGGRWPYPRIGLLTSTVEETTSSGTFPIVSEDGLTCVFLASMFSRTIFDTFAFVLHNVLMDTQVREWNALRRADDFDAAWWGPGDWNLSDFLGLKVPLQGGKAPGIMRRPVGGWPDERNALQWKNRHLVQYNGNADWCLTSGDTFRQGDGEPQSLVPVWQKVMKRLDRHHRCVWDFVSLKGDWTEFSRWYHETYGLPLRDGEMFWDLGCAIEALKLDGAKALVKAIYSEVYGNVTVAISE